MNTTSIALIALTLSTSTLMAQPTIKQTAGRDQLGDCAPQVAA